MVKVEHGGTVAALVVLALVLSACVNGPGLNVRLGLASGPTLNFGLEAWPLHQHLSQTNVGASALH